MPNKRKSFFANFSASWFGLWLFLSSPFQSVKAQVQTEVSPVIKATTIETTKFYISGTVVNENNETLPYVRLKLVELGKGALTDINGKFEIVFEDNPFGKYTLEVWGSGFVDTIRISNISPNTSDVKVVLTSYQLRELVGVLVVEPKLDVFEPKTWTPRRNKRSRKQ